jgi:mannose-1-phosphate guanylyltransferase
MRHAVIMAGGSGTRLWPLSRAERPKQLLDIISCSDAAARGAGEGGPGQHGGAHSLLAEAFSRARQVVPEECIWVCTAARYADVVRSTLPQLSAERLVLEPVARDTANAVGLSAAVVSDVDPDAEIAMMSADHIIRPLEKFRSALWTAFEAVAIRPESMVTLGITPTEPATGFGYVRRGDATEIAGVAEVASFREKPDRATAAHYLTSGEYLWNSGMFVWRAQTVLEALRVHLPKTAEGLARVVAEAPGQARAAVLAEVFPTLPKVSVDYALLEAAATEPGRVLVVDCDVDWLDVGSWPALGRTLPGDGSGNTVHGLAVIVDGSGNVVFSDDPDHLIALVGVHDSVVVHTSDVTMICPVADAEGVKRLLAAVNERLPDSYD